MVCTLTGKLINKSEVQVWKHMLGSKFQKCLGTPYGIHYCTVYGAMSTPFALELLSLVCF